MAENLEFNNNSKFDSDLEKEFYINFSIITTEKEFVIYLKEAVQLKKVSILLYYLILYYLY